MRLLEDSVDLTITNLTNSFELTFENLDFELT